MNNQTNQTNSTETTKTAVYTVKHAALQLNVTTVRVHGLIKQSRLTAVKDGHHTYVTKASFDAFVTNRTTSSNKFEVLS